ncbi:MAG: ATP-binding cassette domain-containing protein [Nitrospiraceae bacterium]|nr:ATP-binding cassette domain-containing protein [Nitrospiraceae bacterium]
MSREILTSESLRKYFEAKGPLGRAGGTLRAVDGIDFSISDNRVFALVGESGCGKSTVARLVLRLIAPTSGRVLFKGKDVLSFAGDELKAYRKSVQIIFQDPFASLNPRRTVYDTISEPLLIHSIVPKNRFRDRVVEILGTVGLGPETLNRYPHEFSGGQRQRICIARALSVSPEIIVADEPLSALDVSIQAQILNLLIDLKEKSRLSYLFISHDLRVVHYLSDEVGVMYLGRIVEHAKTEELFSKPFHPYTEVLLASAPKLKTEGERVRQAPLKGEVPSPVSIPPGCPFHPRCPRRFAPCDRIVPRFLESHGRLVSCHLWNPY